MDKRISRQSLLNSIINWYVKIRSALPAGQISARSVSLLTSSESSGPFRSDLIRPSKKKAAKKLLSNSRFSFNVSKSERQFSKDLIQSEIKPWSAARHLRLVLFCSLIVQLQMIHRFPPFKTHAFLQSRSFNNVRELAQFTWKF